MAETTSHTTTDHKTIQSWVDERGGRPARVKGTESKNTPGLLRIDYPGFSGEDTLEEISWEEFSTALKRTAWRFFIKTKLRTARSAAFRNSSIETRRIINRAKDD